MNTSASRRMLVLCLFGFAVVWILFMGLVSFLFAGGKAASGAAPVDDGSVRAKVSSLDRGKDFEISLALRITDKADKIVENLTEQDIEVYEDGQLVHFENFQPAGKGAIRLCLVMDASRSMNQAAKWSEAVRAARNLLLMLNQTDYVGLHCFNDPLYDNKNTERFKLLPLTRKHLLDSWDAIRATGLGEGSPMCGTIERGLDSLAQVSGRRVMIVLTDGMDTGEPAEVEQKKQRVIAKANELKVPLYMVSTSTADADAKSMQELANGSPGGQYHPVADPKKLSEIFENIGKSLQNEYTLTYKSPDPVENGRTRRVTVYVRNGQVGTTVKGEYPVPGVAATGGSARGAGGGLSVGTMLMIFVALSALLGLLSLVPSMMKKQPVEGADESRPAAPSAGAPVAQMMNDPTAISGSRPPLPPQAKRPPGKK